MIIVERGAARAARGVRTPAWNSSRAARTATAAAMGLLDQPDLLGPSIAVAFVATIYGVGSANIIFLPVANRYKAYNHDIAHFKMMVLEGLISIASGENTMQLKRRLQVYLGEE